jgi:hypothetical protein
VQRCNGSEAKRYKGTEEQRRRGLKAYLYNGKEGQSHKGKKVKNPGVFDAAALIIGSNALRA